MLGDTAPLEGVMRNLFAAMLMLVLAGCASPAATDTATDMEKEAGKSWVSCIHDAIVRLDDGTSDPVSIAYGIEPLCATFYEKSVEYITQTATTPEAILYARNLANDNELHLISSFILTTRAAHTKSVGPDVASSGSLKEAISAYEHGDYATAMRLFSSLAEHGDAEAQDMLGGLYEFGRGVRQDYSEAVVWYRKAADQDDADGEDILGQLYEYGQGVPQDYAEAARWYRKAADQGDAKAQVALGQLYEIGQGVPQDYAEAARWYRKAANQGEALGQSALGILYFGGHGVPQDDVQAYEWITLASTRSSGDNIFDTAMRGQIIKWRDQVAVRMTPAQIADAQQRAATWQPTRSGK
jgi:TPR repeat protein